MKSFFLKNFGCKINFNESKLISKYLKLKNFKELNSFKISNIILINTCYIRNNSFNKFIKFINKYKNKLYIIIGCISNILSIYLLNKINNINIIIESSYYYLIDKIIYNLNFYNCKQIILKINFVKYYKNFKNNNFLIKISDGCNKYCSYCIVPYTKGYEKQEIFINIIKNIFLKFYCKEIFFLSQNINSYYNFLDYNNFKLINFNLLIKYSIQINKLKFINFLSSHLIDYNKNFLKLFKNKKILKFIHLPFQSFSNKILILMKRNYNLFNIKFFIEFINNIILNFTINSDIMLSFIFEYNLDFWKNIIFIEKFLLDKCFIFLYNKRPFTQSSVFINKNLKKNSKIKLIKFKNIIKKNLFYLNKYFLCKNDFLIIKGVCFNFNNIFYSFFKNRLIKIVFSIKFKKIGIYKNLFNIKFINNINNIYFLGKILC